MFLWTSHIYQKYIYPIIRWHARNLDLFLTLSFLFILMKKNQIPIVRHSMDLPGCNRHAVTMRIWTVPSGIDRSRRLFSSQGTTIWTTTRRPAASVGHHALLERRLFVEPVLFGGKLHAPSASYGFQSGSGKFLYSFVNLARLTFISLQFVVE
jgi:hypothetical protein